MKSIGILLACTVFLIAPLSSTFGTQREFPFGVSDDCESLLTANRTLLVSGQEVMRTIGEGDYVYIELLSHGYGNVIPFAKVVQVKEIHNEPYFHIISVNGDQYYRIDIDDNSWLNLNSTLGRFIFVTVAEEQRLETTPARKIGNYLIYQLRIEGLDQSGLIVTDISRPVLIPWRYIFLPALSGRLFLWPIPKQRYPSGGFL
jgi:hypothetical protein